MNDGQEDELPVTAATLLTPSMSDPEVWAGLLADVLNHVRLRAPSLTVSVSEYGIGIGDTMTGPVLHVDADEEGNWRVVR